MADATSDIPRELSVGSRVRLLKSLNEEGIIVEDCGDLAGVSVRIDENQTVVGRRWAITLDDGRLMFLDSESLELIS